MSWGSDHHADGKLSLRLCYIQVVGVELVAVQYCHRRHRQKRDEATYALKRQRAVFGDRT